MKIIVKALFSFLFIPLICSAQEIPSFDLAVNVEDKNITYTIETNIPLPIEVMIALDARGLKPSDYAIGFNERETPACSRRSALPLFRVAVRFPCLATLAPQ